MNEDNKYWDTRVGWKDSRGYFSVAISSAAVVVTSLVMDNHISFVILGSVGFGYCIAYWQIDKRTRSEAATKIAAGLRDAIDYHREQVAEDAEDLKG